MLAERSVDCPCCGARFTALLDPGEAGSEYIQDCEVCCRPLRFVLHARMTGEGLDLEVRPEDEP